MATVESFNIADQSNKDLRKKLMGEEQARRSADSALEGVQKQAEDALRAEVLVVCRTYCA